MKRTKSVFNSFIGGTLAIFGISVLACSLVGWIMGEEVQAAGGMMSLAGEGISYASMIQILLFAAFISGFDIVFSCIASKMLVIWQMIISITVYTVVAVIFVVVFRWFPLEIGIAWILFFSCYCLCLFGSMAIVIMKMRSDDKKYARQLSEYKESKKEKKD